MRISTRPEVLEKVRVHVLADMKTAGFKASPDAEEPGGYAAAVRDWLRVVHRSVASRPRRVWISRELQQSSMARLHDQALATVRHDVEQGVSVTHRLTRQYYRAGFNDFLFNAFGIQHLHLGAPGEAKDKTKNHPMAGGTGDLLFIKFHADEAFFLDIKTHDVFKSATETKEIVRVALTNWPRALADQIMPGVTGVGRSFEDAYRLAKSGASTAFELDDVVFSGGGTVLDRPTVNGSRAACTSFKVALDADHVLRRVGHVVEFIQARHVDLVEMADAAAHPIPDSFELDVVQVGSVVVLRERATGMYISYDGTSFEAGYRVALQDAAK